MKLKKFYSLRKDFVILGLTGRCGAGCTKIANLLDDENYIKNIDFNPNPHAIIAEEIKFNISYNYLSTSDNFERFQTINYKDVLLLHLIFEASQQINKTDYIVEIITQYGDNYPEYTNRFGKKSDSSLCEKVKLFLEENISVFELFSKSEDYNLSEFLKKIDADIFVKFYFDSFVKFCSAFYKILNQDNLTKRTRFIHDIAINLRAGGECQILSPEISNDLKNIYTVAESINKIIKLYRRFNGNKAKIVIDSLKNSLELLYFKEKYSGFYMIAINNDENERIDDLKEIIKTNHPQGENHAKEIIELDNAEYKGNDVNDGDFTVPDIENCIQKSDFHIFHSNKSLINSDDREINLNYQLIKLLALIGQPGIITPTPLERTMQVAYNAKYNSGCISRQVGAVVTDKNYSIKSIGWNDVAGYQMPCKLRNATHFLPETNAVPALYSEYELEGGEFKLNDNSVKSFSELIKIDVQKAKLENLEGRNCSFCFKSFQNNFEDEKNQVHTRSLHAEENAMLQIAKNGGIGLVGGYLFTTASPCELCSKKAFQLGIEKIFFIDPYPGIARTHTLKNGINGHGNPSLEMFRGAVGRAFHKLYEPFISPKDEIKILTGFRPTKLKDVIISEQHE
jgi:deoxycytidylate deaminase